MSRKKMIIFKLLSCAKPNGAKAYRNLNFKKKYFYLRNVFLALAYVGKILKKFRIHIF
jgi:hypothetical protein